eukprot:scaffold48804_cov54-Phaeocystis_antarctica.AAC.2
MTPLTPTLTLTPNPTLTSGARLGGGRQCLQDAVGRTHGAAGTALREPPVAQVRPWGLLGGYGEGWPQRHHAVAGPAPVGRVCPRAFAWCLLISNPS